MLQRHINSLEETITDLQRSISEAAARREAFEVEKAAELATVRKQFTLQGEALAASQETVEKVLHSLHTGPFCFRNIGMRLFTIMFRNVYHL